MRKRVLPLLFALVFFSFPACGENARGAAEAFREGVLTRFPLRFEASLSVSLGEDLALYRLAVLAEEAHTDLALLEPEALSGLSARVEGKDLSLTYDGILFSTEIPEGMEGSPLTLIPGALEALRDGVLTESFFRGKELIADFTRYDGEDAVTYRFVFRRDGGAVDSVAVLHEGKEIASAAFSPSL